ncbi:hypothetical protein LTR87_016159 [Friedmanniomyces endolithicus]|nr:hypothetical protein LTR87_016159 [Friedmanniomyces endolithicus]
MASQPGFSLECSLPTGEVLSPGEVDAWELKAARRGLQNLKTLLEGQAMLDLLTKQIEEGDAYFKGIIAKSKGQFNESRIDFKAIGITSSQFLKWQTNNGRRQFFLDSMAPAHPEHYALGPYPMGIVETIGNHICRVRVDNVVEVPDFVKAYGDASYNNKMPVTGFLDDGTLFFYGFQELRDTDDGCDFRFQIIFPAAAPPVLFDEHAENLAIEFRSWIATAFESHQK